MEKKKEKTELEKFVQRVSAFTMSSFNFIDLNRVSDGSIPETNVVTLEQMSKLVKFTTDSIQEFSNSEVPYFSNKKTLSLIQIFGDIISKQKRLGGWSFSHGYEKPKVILVRSTSPEFRNRIIFNSFQWCGLTWVRTEDGIRNPDFCIKIIFDKPVKPDFTISKPDYIIVEESYGMDKEVLEREKNEIIEYCKTNSAKCIFVSTTGASFNADLYYSEFPSEIFRPLRK